MTIRLLRNFVLFLLLNLLSYHLQAQIISAGVGVNGLTCSQCSRSVEMQLRKLPFVKEVQMDLEHTHGTLTFRDDSKVDFSAIARAVTDAGFSVRSLEARIDMEHIPVADDHSFRINSGIYVILNDITTPQGITTFRFMGKKFSASKEKYNRPALPKPRGNQVIYEVIAGG